MTPFGLGAPTDAACTLKECALNGSNDFCDEDVVETDGEGLGLRKGATSSEDIPNFKAYLWSNCRAENSFELDSFSGFSSRVTF